MASKYDRSVALNCPTCGCTQFQVERGVDESVELVKCASCLRELTKDELIKDNDENISTHVNEIKEQLVQDIRKDFKKFLGKF